MQCSFFYKKGLLSTHPTLFSRLPSLIAADKPCPQLQPFLVENPGKSRFSPLVETVTIQDDENNGPEPELVDLSDDNDDDEILEIFDQNNIFTQFRPVNNPEFISEDPRENEDINDPEWEKVKNLKDDAERRQFAIDTFNNFQPGDPTKNMTYYGFFRQQLRREQVG